MKKILLVVAGVVLLLAQNAFASERRFYRIDSPDHEQTFSYGSEQSRVWAERGSNRHLVVLLNFTNDPFVDRTNPRQYDNFTFSFPSVTLGQDGHTFYYRSKDGRNVSVAAKKADFLGINEIKLLPNARLIVNKPHGYLSLQLVVEDANPARD